MKLEVRSDEVRSGQSRGDNSLSRKKDQKKHGVHSTVTKHAYPSRHQRKIAYTNIFLLGSIVRVFFVTH